MKSPLPPFIKGETVKTHSFTKGEKISTLIKTTKKSLLLRFAKVEKISPLIKGDKWGF
ncbi:MAG: hypothetical protein LBQ24_04140 [Candidatus Peribacteria bacterium]|nr:hypothetical protein [Candidatus Peribacteria bacterium]